MKEKKMNEACPARLRATQDALDVINGKWRVPIIVSLTFGDKRFGEIQRDIPNISPKMLSKELRELEMYKLISRTVYDTKPVTVEYALTPMGKSLDKLLLELLTWGEQFRKKMLSKN
jgi:DNA-binding HxlR family transcriptional regulator